MTSTGWFQASSSPSVAHMHKAKLTMGKPYIHVGPIGQGGLVKKICFFFTTYGPNFPGEGINKIFRQGGYTPLTPPLPPVHTYGKPGFQCSIIAEFQMYFRP